MAKLRSSHVRDKRPMAGIWLRAVLLIVLTVALFLWLWPYLAGRMEDPKWDIEHDSGSRTYLYPSGGDYQIVDHTYYSLGYDEKSEQAAWVAYVLNSDELRIPNVERYDWFEDDPDVFRGSATYEDYRGSGYTRGHLAPAGDMAFNEKAMKESFFMSNISPQVRSFNGGIWRELEETVRDWAYRRKRLYVITGPILENTTQFMGRKNRIAVPQFFFKTIVALDSDTPVGIGFIIPNEKSTLPIHDFAVSIDDVEIRTGLDFYDDLFETDEIEEATEEVFEVGLWPYSEKRFRLRLEEWNNN